MGSDPLNTLPRSRTSTAIVNCQYTTDYLQAAKFGAKLGGNPAGAIIGGELAVLANVLLDSRALDDLQAERATPAIAQLSAYAIATPCFHTALTGEDRVISAAADAVRRAAVTGVPGDGFRASNVGMSGYFFTSPSGKFQCAILDGRANMSATAGCHGETQPVSPRPPGCGETIGWGHGMDVWPDTSRTGGFRQADYLCASELVYGLYVGSAKALPYGSSITENNYTCGSAKDGIRCTHNPSGHGFRISSGSNDLF